MWQIVGEGGGSVDTSSFITLDQLSQRLNDFYTKEEVNNEINNNLGGKGFKYLTKDEYERLSNGEKNDENIVYFIIDEEEDVFSLELIGNTLSLLKNGVSISSVVIPSNTSNGEDVIKVESISLNKSNCSIKVNETVQLSYAIAPSNATNQNVIWSTSNSNCTVENGLVTAKNIGECIITATTEDGGKVSTCEIVIEGNDSSEGEQYGAELVHSYVFEEGMSDKVNSFDVENRKAIRNDNLLIGRFESFSIKLSGYFTSVYADEFFNTYPEFKNSPTSFTPIYGRFKLYRDISHGIAKGDVKLVYYDEQGAEKTITTNGQIPRDSEATVVIIYDKDKNETNIYVNNQNAYTGNIMLNIDGLGIAGTVRTLELYNGVIEVGE